MLLVPMMDVVVEMDTTAVDDLVEAGLAHAVVGKLIFIPFVP